MKKLINLLCLALCLCLAVPALAAPHRDRRTVTDLSEELETAVSLFGGASLLRDVYELTDLKIGRCRMAVAAPAGARLDPEKTLRVATKFSHIAKTYAGGLWPAPAAEPGRRRRRR